MKSNQKRTLSYTAFKILGGKHIDLFTKKRYGQLDFYYFNKTTLLAYHTRLC